MADREVTQLIRAYLMTRYAVTNTDVQPLLARYLVENPNGLTDQTKVFKEVVAAAQ